MGRTITQMTGKGGCIPLGKSHSRLQLRASRQIITTTKKITTSASRRRIPILGQQRLLKTHKNKPNCVRRSNSSSPTGVSAPAAAKEVAKEPPLQVLRWVAFTTGLPFIGFGFMDNAILIIAGDAIDTSLGVTLGISTMCAAAIGNIVSDLAGIGCAAYIEEFCATTLKLPIPALNSAQRQLRSVRMASQGGMAIGMTIGCVIGMIPLLFIDSKKADKLRNLARLERLYQDVLNEAKTLVGAESTCLYLRVDKEEENDNTVKPQQRRGATDYAEILSNYHPSVNGGYLYAMYYQHGRHSNTGPSTTNTLMRMVSGGSRSGSSHSTYSSESEGRNSNITAYDNENSDIDSDSDSNDMVTVTPPAPPSSHHSVSGFRVVPVGKGIVSRAVLTGTTWNIAGSLMDEPDFYPLSIETANSCTDIVDDDHFRDIVVVPILDGQGRVIAVLEALNKKREIIVTKSSSISTSSTGGGFTDEDVEILSSLASHVSVSLQRIYQDGEEERDLRLRDTIRILKEGKGIRRSNARTSSGNSSNTDGGDNNSNDSDSQINGSNENTSTSSSTSPFTAGRKKVKLFPN